MDSRDEAVSKLDEWVKQIPGYKIADTHYRVGSKIHISDFYYAKRLFQSSFFASKFAFLITRYIREQYFKDTGNIAKIAEEGLTLIGYGSYSALLMSFIEKFLRSLLGEKAGNINHNLINDSEELLLIKGKDQVYQNIIIIVPIASTFSTSVKIEESLLKMKSTRPYFNILSPHINVLLIDDQQVFFQESGEIISDVVKKFGWESIDKEKRELTIRTLGGAEIDHEKKQKYFLELPTNWHNILDCSLCMPHGQNREKGQMDERCSLIDCIKCEEKGLDTECILQERCLYITDKASVTPTLILDRFKEKQVKSDYSRNLLDIQPSDLAYGHWKRGEQHYKYYIHTNELFKKNREAIKKWLEQLRGLLSYKPDENILIIAPGHFANADFVNLVNEQLFSYAANVIHYDPSKDHIQNFELFYKDDIDRADKIYFVDDVVMTGETFITANYFLKHTIQQSQDENKKVFDACFVFIDRSGWDVYDNILRKLKSGGSLYAFTTLYLHLMQDDDKCCPLCQQKEWYEKMSKNSFLDRMKVHYMRQEAKMKVRNIYSDNRLEEDGGKHGDKERFLRRVEAIHRVCEWFQHSGERMVDFPSYYDWKESLNRLTSSPFLNTTFVGLLEVGKQSHLNADDYALLKVLTQAPFMNYLPIRNVVFKWVLNLLFEQVKQIKTEIENDERREVKVVKEKSKSRRSDKSQEAAKDGFQIETFLDFKFLIRRAGFLQINFLISPLFLEAMELFYGKNFDRLKAKIKSENYSGITEGELMNFGVYYVAQLKELLDENEAKSIRLEQIINNVLYSGRTISPRFKQILRIMQVENSVLIKKVWEFFHTRITLEEMIEEPVQMNRKMLRHYKGDTFSQLMEADMDMTTSKVVNCVLNYFRVMNLLTNEELENEEDVSIETKTEQLVDTLKKFISEDNIGAFFIVKHDSKMYPYLFTYNKGDKGVVNESFFDMGNYSYLLDFLNGCKDDSGQVASRETIIEFEKRKITNGVGITEEVWIDLYSTEAEGSSENIAGEEVSRGMVAAISPNFVPENYNRLLLLRINRKKWDEEKQSIEDIPQGMIGFYYKEQEGRAPLKVNTIRYLLLLRDALSHFIKIHHETDEFHDLVDERRKQKLSMLMGHGREMLLELIERGNSHPIGGCNLYKEIVLTIEHLQLIVTLDTSIAGGDSKALQTFKRFYYVNGMKNLTAATFDNIKLLADDVFASKEVECEVQASIEHDYLKGYEHSEIEFAFSIPILYVICFELFINAKKNRWHFQQDESFVWTEKDGTQKVYTQNILRIEYGIKIQEKNPVRKLIVKISNTGPAIDEATKKCLERNIPPKIYDRVSGIGLIIRLLEKNGFGLGDIRFEYSILDKQNRLSIFSVILEINEMNPIDF